MGILDETRKARRATPNARTSPSTNGVAAHMPWERKPDAGLPDPGVLASDLLMMDIPPAKFAVDELLCEGLTLLGGRPKMGKSWLALLIGWAVAGGNTLDGRIVRQGPVLYLSLEDTRRRLKSRIEMLQSSLGWEVPSALKIHTIFPRADQGGLYFIAEWLSQQNGAARLVIVDTMPKFRRPGKSNSGNQSQDDYTAFGEIKQLVEAYGASALGVVHTRKAPAEDPFDELSGTLSISAAADGLMVLERKRGADEAKLFVTGRDVIDMTIPMRLDRESFRWHLGRATEGIDTTGRHVSPVENKVEACMAWVREFLAEYAYPSREIAAAAKAAEFSFDTLKHAKARLGRDGTGELVNRNYGFAGGNDWWSGLGPADAWTKRPEDGVLPTGGSDALPGALPGGMFHRSVDDEIPL